MVIERASPADLAMLALDRRGGVPQHLGVVLLLDPQPRRSTEDIRRVLVERIPAVPRLRQRLLRTPFGCGPPIWVDDPAFDPARHVRVQPNPASRDERALLDLAAAVMTEPLSRSHPPWAAVVAPCLGGGRLAVVLVLHHVLADGLGGWRSCPDWSTAPKPDRCQRSRGPHPDGGSWPRTRSGPGCAR